MRIYTRDEIQTVYHRHHYHTNSVVYSQDGGYTWQSVPMDSGKWKHDWIFAFIEKEVPKVNEVKCAETGVKNASLTQGEIYKVLAVHGGMYCIVDDHDELVTVHSSYFEN